MATITLYKANLNITSAQLLALDAHPLVIAPAPGVGFYICVFNFSYEYVAGATPYTPADPSDVLGVGTDPVNGYFQFAVNQTGFIDQATSQVAPFGAVDVSFLSGNPAPLTEENNKPLYVGATTAPTAGNGTLNVIVYYTIEPVL